MSRVLAEAFRALGDAPTNRELALVRSALDRSGDDEALDALDAAAEAVGQDDNAAFDALVALAESSGSSAFVALDLVTEL